MNWSAETWAAFFGALVVIGGLLASMLGMAFKLGGLANDFARATKRIDALEAKAEVVDAKLNAVEVLKMSIDDLKRQVSSLRRDIVQLLRGKIKIIPLSEEDEEEDSHD